MPKPRSKIVRDDNGQLILDEYEIMTRWNEYIEDLYKWSVEGNSMNIENRIDPNEEDIGPNIIKKNFLKH